MFNKEGYKVKAYYTTKNCTLESIKKVHIIPNLLTFDDLYQNYQKKVLKIIYDTLVFKCKQG